MTSRSRLQWVILLLTIVPLLPRAFGQDIPDPMYPYRLVNDFAEIFSPTERQALEQKLLAYNDSTSTQLYVVTVSDLGGYAAPDFAFRLGEKWQIGQAGRDNGAVILIKPKVGNSRGEAFIATGYGLEAKVNGVRGSGRTGADDSLLHGKRLLRGNQRRGGRLDSPSLRGVPCRGGIRRGRNLLGCGSTCFASHPVSHLGINQGRSIY